MEKGRYDDALRAVRERASREAHAAGHEPTKADEGAAVSYFRALRREDTILAEAEMMQIAGERQIRQLVGDERWTIFDRVYSEKLLEPQEEVDRGIAELMDSDKPDDLKRMHAMDMFRRYNNELGKTLQSDERLKAAFVRRRKLLADAVNILLKRNVFIFEKSLSEYFET